MTIKEKGLREQALKQNKTLKIIATSKYNTPTGISTLKMMTTGPFPAVGVAFAKALLARFVGQGVMR